MGKIGEELAEQREKGDDQAPEDSGGQKRAVGASNTRIDPICWEFLVHLVLELLGPYIFFFQFVSGAVVKPELKYKGAPLNPNTKIYSLIICRYFLMVPFYLQMGYP